MLLTGIKNIAIIGAGNVATHLALALKDKNKQIIQVYSRTEESAKALAGKVSASYTTKLHDLTGDADLYIISVSDSAVRQIAGNISLTDKLVVHTSGSLPIDILKNTSSHYGVFYPFQTFSKKIKLDFTSIPVCVEANTKENQEALIRLGKELSGDARIMNSEQRTILHLAGIFACNFSNNMYAITADIFSKHNIPFDIIRPVINETAKKINTVNPFDAQTGPAVREDMEIINKHLDLLSEYPDYKEIYDLITRNIIKLKHRNG